jgi:hypothetical protein
LIVHTANGTDIRDRRRHGREPDLDLSGDQIGHRRAIATIGHVLKVGAGHCVEQLSRQMARGPNAGRGKAELAWIGLRVRDQFRNCLYWNRRINLDHIRHAHYAADRRRVTNKIKA